MPRYTRRDLEQLPEGTLAEVVEGVLVMPPAPDAYHQGLVLDLARALDRFLGPEGRDRVLVSPVDVVIDDENVVQPDVLVLPEGTKRTRAPWRIPLPVWVAEVLSPSTEAWDRGPKLRAYRRAGVAEVWLVDPEARTVTVHDLEADRNETETVARSRVLSGFQVKISELFAV